MMMKKSTVRQLDELEDVMVVERGLNGRSSNNVHFAVQLKFTNNDLLDVYEVNHRADAKRKVGVWDWDWRFGIADLELQIWNWRLIY